MTALRVCIACRSSRQAVSDSPSSADVQYGDIHSPTEVSCLHVNTRIVIRQCYQGNMPALLQYCSRARLHVSSLLLLLMALVDGTGHGCLSCLAVNCRQRMQCCT